MGYISIYTMCYIGDYTMVWWLCNGLYRCSLVTLIVGSCTTKVDVLLRWLYYWGSCITEVAVLLRWLYYWGSCTTKVAVLLR